MHPDVEAFYAGQGAAFAIQGTFNESRERALGLKTKTKPTTKISKNDALLKLLHSNSGATLAQMQRVTGWQPHSVRAFLSGTVKKKLGLKLESKEGRRGERRYVIEEI